MSTVLRIVAGYFYQIPADGDNANPPPGTWRIQETHVPQVIMAPVKLIFSFNLYCSVT